MPNMHWSKLSPMQLGRYAEYYAKMEFSSYGFDVYTSEVDDHGVDFVAKSPRNHVYYEIQVKSIRDTGYVFMKKTDMPLTENRLVCVLIFSENRLPEVFIIPSTAWKTTDGILVSHDYDNPGQKSRAEWGLNLSKKNIPLLEKYNSEKYFEDLID